MPIMLQIMLHYADIKLYAFHCRLCQKLRQHNRCKPTWMMTAVVIMKYSMIAFCSVFTYTEIKFVKYVCVYLMY